MNPAHRVVFRLGLLALLCVVLGCSSSGSGTGCQSPFNLLLTGSSGAGADCLDVTLDPQAIPGEQEDAGACGAAAGDNACALCLKTACCTEGVACIAADDSCTAANPTPAYRALATCAAEPCAGLCPGEP